jgi:hypothetical protein
MTSKSTKKNNSKKVPTKVIAKIAQDNLQNEKNHEETLDKQLIELGLKRKCIPKDGSCLFRACSDLLFNTQSFHKHMRAKVVKFLELNRALHEPYVYGTGFDTYCKLMRRSNTWAGQLELEAIAQCYQCNITVYSIRGIETEHMFHNNPDIIESVKRDGAIPAINLCFLHGNHYDAVYTDSFFSIAGFCQEIVYNDILKKGLDIVDSTPNHSPLYQNYRNVEYNIYLEDLRLQQLADEEMARQIAQKREQKNKPKEIEEEEQQVETGPYEVKTVVATGKVISYSEQLMSTAQEHAKETEEEEKETEEIVNSSDLTIPTTADLTISVPQSSERKQKPMTKTPPVQSVPVSNNQTVSYSQLAQYSGKTDPDAGWDTLSTGNDPVPSTHLIPIKSPYNSRDYSNSYDLKEFCASQTRQGRKIGLIIDLANVRVPLFDYRSDVPPGIEVVKLGTENDINVPSEQQVQKFITIVDEYLSKNPDTYILVSCTFGINRTGFFICEYLIRTKKFTVEQATATFAMGRKYAIYHPMFLDELFQRHKQLWSDMYQRFQYPAFPAFCREKYMINVGEKKLLEKRSLSFKDFNFDALQSIDDLSQFDSIELPQSVVLEQKQQSKPKNTKKKKQKNKGKKQQQSSAQNSTSSQQQAVEPVVAAAPSSIWANIASNDLQDRSIQHKLQQSTTEAVNNTTTDNKTKRPKHKKSDWITVKSK